MLRITTAVWIGISLLLFTFSSPPAKTTASRYDSIIVLKVDDLNGDLYQRISTSLDSDANTNIEYACLWSGVIVIKFFNSTISNKADAQMYVRTRIGKASPGASLEFLHVFVEQSRGSTKC